MKTRIYQSALFALALIFSSTASAQTSANVSQSITLNLQNQIDISITAAPGVSFSFATTDDYANGIVNTSASQFQVRSNKTWVVTVNAGTANFSGPTGNTMPASVLGVRLNGGSTFTQLATTAANLTNGNRGVSSFNVDYKANPGFSYDAGTYTLNVVYTATQQ